VAVSTRRLLLLSLRTRRRIMWRAGCGQFCSGWMGSCPATTAVKADAARRDVVDDGCVVNIGDICGAYVAHRGVVVEEAVIPISAQVADAKVAEAVVNPAIETNRWPPVARIPHVHAVVPRPIARSP